jgi:phage terminase large subunit
MTGTNPQEISLAPYAPLPWQYPVLRDKSEVVLLTGGAGGGKSRTYAEKVHMYLQKYPGATGLMIRKTREAATRSCVPMMWETVIGGVRSGVQFNRSESFFRYPNGSVLYTGGMKDDEQRQAIRSIGGKGAVDIIWVEEANKITLEDYQELLARLRGTAASWQQIGLTTNPDYPLHWINQRLIIGGEARVYYSDATLNTYNSPQYIGRLKTLTGTQKQRLVDGKWVQAEGVIYENFDIYDGGNVTDEADYNPDWPIVWGVDDGYAQGKGKGSDSYHPRVFLLCQYTPTGGLNVFAEYYKTQELPELSLKNVLEMPYPTPEIAYVDSSAAELKTRIWTKSIQTLGATHKVTEGIKNLRRLIGDGNGVRLLKVHPRCVELIGEMQSYSKAESVVAVVGEPKPAKVNDHGPDALRYAAWRLRFEE